MATTKKKVVKKLPANDEFIVLNDGAQVDAEGSTLEKASNTLINLVQDEGGDSFYRNREYTIYKLVKRVRVNIEHPLPVVKLIPVKD